MQAFDTLVRSGKVRYIGLSDIPAWYLARAQTIAEWRGYEKICSLQLEYSLAERNIEYEHVPAALELGMGICPWSPLASGLLTGKYSRDDIHGNGKGRLHTLKDSGNPVFEKLTERNFQVVDALMEVSSEVGRRPAEVALNWITKRPGVTSTIIGATKLEQLESNLMALEFDIPEHLSKKLDDASRPDARFPYIFHDGSINNMVRGMTTQHAEPAWFRKR